MRQLLGTMFGTASFPDKQGQERPPGALSGGGNVYRLCQLKVFFYCVNGPFPYAKCSSWGVGKEKANNLLMVYAKENTK